VATSHELKLEFAALLSPGHSHCCFVVTLAHFPEAVLVGEVEAGGQAFQLALALNCTNNLEQLVAVGSMMHRMRILGGE
jgi:hypothetical protein